MHLIHAVSIRRFRSISDMTIAVGELTAIVGGNGSGKSNILRPLNLCFNGEVEAGDPLRLQRDVHRPWNKKTPVIDVAVEFKLPKTFSIHKSLVEPLKKVGVTAGGHACIQKTWLAGGSPDEPPVVEIRIGASLTGAAAAEEDLARLECRERDATRAPEVDLIDLRAGAQELVPAMVGGGHEATHGRPQAYVAPLVAPRRPPQTHPPRRLPKASPPASTPATNRVATGQKPLHIRPVARRSPRRRIAPKNGVGAGLPGYKSS